ncbi:hypothetical protein K469DRAFT_699959 [Zopfia rhizophila CBS 207.26]|uniref:Uncharacterized protein n=1 Tax=Zopfia rhizophila CBS 207.26 TaxID=1314779 RepID=A0A6A6EI31_9PEZI|nr:hypothetical protein K469DRAFT_699959 [Zopfia rhizophila CBS 207.26]
MARNFLISPHIPATALIILDKVSCAADSNLEPVNSELGGITGWGNTRVCRDFRQLAEWATKWKDGDNQGAD